MPDSSLEAVLQALATALSGQMPADATFKRNVALPSEIPPGGLGILRDGEPGEPEITMSPLRYEYDHVAEFDIHAGDPLPGARDATFDALKQAIAPALAADRSLGGLAIDVRARAPRALLIKTVDGASEIKAATVPIVVTFVTTDPLT
ncbi:hypothetical protein [Roseovarius indicus]|uniref:hypothetical protein n=1 Tax=Roseovarius indicus TaxID=540747 RepID=UPI0007D93859|nr:hypothetical protein [Roseovarius indicus]OAO02713.1 hypothetical protein A8B76_05060 [Roseovarius indicus]